MPADSDNLEARIDREKRQREDDLLAFLLLLFLRARSHADLALRLGANPLDAIRDVLLGNPTLNLPGGAYRVAQAIADAEAAGFRRTLKAIGAPERVTLIETKPNATHLSLARQHVAQMFGTIQRRIYLALGKSTGGVAGARKAVYEAFETWGYVDPVFNGSGRVYSATSKAWAAVFASEAIVGNAFNAGMMGGYQTPDAQAVATALRFTTVRDERRTQICKVRDGVTLPLDDPWWFRNWPMLHGGCRSIVLPLTGRGVKFTENPPEVPPPDAGWGHWAGMLSAFSRAA